MGYCFSIFAVDLKELTTAVGSRNANLLDDLLASFADDFDQYDEMAENAHDEESDDEPLTMEAALRQIVMGEEYRSGVGFMYGYALEFLCRYFGDMLTNEHWSAMPSPSDWIETVDAELEKQGVPAATFRMTNQTYGKSPIPIPEIDDWPCIGCLKFAEMAEIQSALDQIDFSAIETESVASAIREVQRWLKTCLDSQRDLMIFLA